MNNRADGLICPGDAYAPHLNSQDLDIIEALNDRQWDSARNLVQDAVRNNLKLHAETWLLVAEKLCDENRDPPKRSRGQPIAIEDLAKQMSLGEQIDNFVNDHEGPYYKAIDEAAAEFHLGARTAEKYRALWRRLRREEESK